jgi:membrane-bound lytic murein transglycosylase B
MVGRVWRQLAAGGAILLLTVALASGCTPAAGQQPAAESPASGPTATPPAADSSQAPAAASPFADAPMPFPSWVAGLRDEALSAGISSGTFDRALASVAPLPRVIELDRRQPEGTISFATYVSRVVSPARIAAGRRHMAENAALLQQIQQRYHVQPRFIVALWAVESSFGQSAGDTPTIPALATLAYDGRRSRFFRSELLAALRILERGAIAPERMRGSWAGAMGQCQFMPSSYLKYAVAFEGSGQPDIWSSRADVLASIANYLATVGWSDHGTWGREVTLPANFDAGLVDLKVKKSLGSWAKLGVRRADGGALPVAALNASLVRPDGGGGRAFLVYDDYRTLMDWNRSTYFATSIGLLADAIGDSDAQVAQAGKRNKSPPGAARSRRMSER